jgi:putative Mn2+ efflux pump MntP
LGWITLFGVAVALALDAFAVALVAGATIKPLTGRHLFRLSFHFGLFQALMPALGWLAGKAVHRYIESVDHWVAFGLLSIVGGRMIWGAVRGGDNLGGPVRDPTSGLNLVLLSVATSIDALAVGLSLAVIGVAILLPAVVIGLVAAGFTLLGMLLGGRVRPRHGRGVEVAGGILLIAIGVRILAEHLL